MNLRLCYSVPMRAGVLLHRHIKQHCRRDDISITAYNTLRWRPLRTLFRAGHLTARCRTNCSLQRIRLPPRHPDAAYQRVHVLPRVWCRCPCRVRAAHALSYIALNNCNAGRTHRIPRVHCTVRIVFIVAPKRLWRTSTDSRNARCTPYCSLIAGHGTPTYTRYSVYHIAGRGWIAIIDHYVHRVV